MVTATFIIPALNEEAHLARCLSSIRDQSTPENISLVEIVVVDNHSTDGTVRVAESHGARVVQVAPGNIGRARNEGARAAQGDILAFIDADCELDRDWLARLSDHLRDPGVVAAGSTLAAPRPDASWVEETWYRLAHAPAATEVRRVDWLASFNLLVRKDTFLGCGGFDEKLVTCEDVDLSYRLSRSGRLLQDASVPTRHHGESKRLRELFRREAWRGRGALRSLVQSRFAWRELRSVAVPCAFAALGAAALAGVAGGLIARSGQATAVGLALLAVTLALPAAVVLRKLSPPRRLRDIGRAWALMSTYLAARALGLVRSAERVSRR